ncbi:MAG: sigma-54-dependent Fis family transcriptional regulator [Deltaproteobacteria bacterium]|nr:sigma-54-dependent Fis family transcriptional regulator [Deltaproteobacteria bacterium]
MAAKQILIIDDYPQLVDFLTERLSAEGYAVRTAATGADGMAAVASFTGVVLLDVRLPDGSGLDLFQKIKSVNADLPVIFITAHATVDMAVEATRQGAFDFIAKGSDLLKRLNVAVKNAFDRLAMTEQLRRLTTQLSEKVQFDQFITVSPRTQQILNTLEAVVNSGVSVLVEGESGTGKELIARAIHVNGARRGGPFVAVNCAGIPETLLESEMFGYEKGAFTGATARRAGKFESAHNGTLFLDEVGELPKSLQAKLLRVLQDHTFERVGGNETVSADVRIVSATNRDLMAEVKAGRFREDLFYRLSVFPVRLPPLRERPEDVPVLAQHFLRRFGTEEGKTLTGFAAPALAVLASHPFPGNVRELENMVRHAVILARGPEITEDDVAATLGSHRVHVAGTGPGSAKPIAAAAGTPLPDRLSAAFPTFESIATIRELQLAYLQRALRASGGNVSKAARALGLGRATMYRWMKGEVDGNGGGDGVADG